MNYPLASSSWDNAEVEAATAVLRSGRCTMGEKTLEFERDFSEFVGSRHAIMVNSGSSANLLAVASQFYIKDNPLKAGDEVLVPAVAWATTYFPLHQYGLRIRLVDISSATLNADDAVYGNAKAAVLVNLLGNPSQMVWSLRDRFGNYFDKTPILIEDNCESLGASVYVARPMNTEFKFCGTFGKVGTFSTFFSHHISTIEGGMIVTNDDETADIVRCLRAHGWTRELGDKNHVLDKGEDQWQERFRFVLPGYNLRPTDVAAAIGIEQLKKLPMILKVRRENAVRFRCLLNDLNHNEILMTGQKEVGKSSWYGLALTLQGRMAWRRTELVAKLAEAGIETRPVMSGLVCKHPVWRNFDYYPENQWWKLPNADYLDHNGFFLGNAGKDLSDELEHTFKVIKEFADV